MTLGKGLGGYAVEVCACAVVDDDLVENGVEAVVLYGSREDRGVVNGGLMLWAVTSVVEKWTPCSELQVRVEDVWFLFWYSLSQPIPFSILVLALVLVIPARKWLAQA